MRVHVEKITGKDLLNNAMIHVFGIQSKASLKKWYNSEHSPARTQMFAIYITDLPYCAAMQLRTHDKNGALMLVESGRPDTGSLRSKEYAGNYREAPRNMFVLCNAQHLMDWSRKRLCNKAEKQIRALFLLLRERVRDVDPDLADMMMPKCLYMGGRCNEFKPCGKIKNTKMPV